jgi:branched-chain amino acid transport system substrate-binding protein
VAVRTNGALEEIENGEGLSKANTNSQLIHYARALLTTDRDDISFIWISGQGQWMSVQITAERDQAAGSRAELRMIDIDPPDSLTLRELDVMTLVAAGLSNEAISACLDVSPRTITKHVENIFAKTMTWTRAGLAGMATDKGLLRLPTPGGCLSYPLGTGAVERAAARLDSAPASRMKPLARRPIFIGMPLSLSGRGKADAKEMLNGAQMAVEQLNERGGVLGRKVELLTVNCDISNAHSLAEAYTSLIENEVDAITAGYSCVEPAIQKLVGSFRAPYLHAATMESAVANVRSDPTSLGNIFQVCASDVNYGLGVARFLTHLELSMQWKPRNRRLVVVQPYWPGLNIGLNEIDRGLGAHGWQIEIVSETPRDGEDWDGVIDRIHRLDPAAIVLASYFSEDSVSFQRAFLARPIASLIYNLYSPSVPTYREELGDLANGVLWATTTGLYSDRIGNDFTLRYRKRYGIDPGQSHASIAYDRINILAGAWSRVGNSRLFDKVAEDLRSTVYRGVNGSYFFGSDGQVGLAYPDDTQDPSLSQAHLVFQIQNGMQRIISPQPYVNGRFQMPSWMLGAG